jgi:hypothetical protein
MKKKVKKPLKRSKKTAPRKKKLKRVARIANGIDIVKKEDGTLIISGKNAKSLEGAIVEQQEREYKFDDRLVPYWLGGDTKESNIAIRSALIKLGKTSAMTELFTAIKLGNLSYREEALENFTKALLAVIKGHDSVGLLHIHETDIQLIHDNNLKTFNEYWEAKSRIHMPNADDFEGFNN